LKAVLRLDSLREFLRLEAAGGIVLGLVAGEQLGVFGAVWLGAKAGLCRKPEATSWAQLYGLAVLCGVGFTMSLLIGGLAFEGPAHSAQVRSGVLGGSIVAAAIGALVLKAASRGSGLGDLGSAG
jgi:NhaA family Na+:H+ antiporter